MDEEKQLCRYSNNNKCNNPANCTGACADFFDCHVEGFMDAHLTCASCIGAGGVWCAAAALCLPWPPGSLLTTHSAFSTYFSYFSTFRPDDASLCPVGTSWVSSCSSVATNPIGNDPMYEAQSWVYDLINVKPVWQAGYTGKGVQVVFNDDGIDLSSDDFGTLPDGSAKFDPDGSCVGYDACVGGAGSTVAEVGGGTCGVHGTKCAAIAVGNANSFCSAGIAPGAKLAGAFSSGANSAFEVF